MATKKKMLQAAAGSATGGASLDITDVFSTYLYTGNGASQVIENGINLGQSNAGGGANFSGANNVRMNVPSSSDFGFGTGDYTVEFFVYKFSDKNYNTYYDQRTASQNSTTASPFLYTDSGGTLYFHLSGTNQITGSGTNVASGAWTHVALCRSSSSTKLFVNGTQIGSTYSDSNNYVTPASNWSVGGSLEQSLYNVEGHMSNVRIVKGSALYTSNFTAPTSALTAVYGTVLLALQGDEPFTDNSASGHSLGNNGALASAFGPFDAADAGEGGLVWVKNRTTAFEHMLADTETGAEKYLSSNTSQRALGPNATALTSFNSNGFSIGSLNDYNYWPDDIASWTFRKAPKFFTCLTYTGNSTNRTISHDLGSAPGMLIVKRTDLQDNWFVYHRSLGATKGIMLNQTQASFTAGYWQNTAPTATEFSIFDDDTVNANGGTYVAYLFAHNDGDGTFGPDGDQDIIKCGSYTTDSNEDATIDLGFEPQWVLFKRTDSSTGGDWNLFDTMRGLTADTSGGGAKLLEPNTSDAELATSRIAVTSTGFKVDNYGASRDYIYMAIRRGPLAPPEAATEVFKPVLATSIDAYSVGFETDFALFNKLAGLSFNTVATTRLQGGGKRLSTATDSAETSSTNVVEFDLQNIFKQNILGTSSLVRYHWKRAPSYFDAVCYLGTGVNGLSMNHNLGVAPEMMWVKQRNQSNDNWYVYHSSLGNTKYLHLNTTAAEATSLYAWDNTSPTSTQFRVGAFNGVNGANNYTYIAYLFASLPLRKPRWCK